jgi:hypothetical protein
MGSALSQETIWLLTRYRTGQGSGVARQGNAGAQAATDTGLLAEDEDILGKRISGLVYV